MDVALENSHLMASIIGEAGSHLSATAFGSPLSLLIYRIFFTTMC